MATKICSKCKQSKSIDEFYFRNKKKGTRQHHCIPCLKEYKDAHYRNNKASYLKRCGKRRNDVKKIIDDNLLTYFSNHPCIDCGEKDPVVLDFDHDNPKDKSLSIAIMRRRQFSWQSILIEISKCSVRCANCHRRRTAKQFNWYRQR